LAGIYTGQLVISVDSGINWSQATGLPPTWLITENPRAINGPAGATVSANASIMAVTDPGQNTIWISRNRGLTWSDAGAPARDWWALACSADGSTLAAVSQGIFSNANIPGIAISTNGGATWALAATPVYRWRSIACSADGSRLLAAGWLTNEENGLIMISTDGGQSWRPSGAPALGWNSVAMSADGSFCLGGAFGAPIMISRDGGTSWTNSDKYPESWMGVACSADGRVVAGCMWGQGIWLSLDWGATWTQENALISFWNSVACSADGQRLVGLTGPTSGPTFAVSEDSGQTWGGTTINTPGLFGEKVASSADGGLFLATTLNGTYIYQTPSTPRLRLSKTGDSGVLSWLAPSTPFSLQQTSDLASGDWTEVAASPSLNTTNLQYQVVLPANAAAGTTFYRLQSR
jgi:hypothetical protein